MMGEHSGTIAKLKQYKNLILVTALAVFFIALLAGDPLGFFAKRAHERSAIHNQMAVEKAQAEQQRAIIQAQTEAELRRIEKGEAYLPILQEMPEEPPDAMGEEESP